MHVSKATIAEVHREVRGMLMKLTSISQIVNQSNRLSLVFVQPPRPPIILNEGVLTRSKSANNNYDDTVEAHNELIGMERSWINAAMLLGRLMPKQQKFKLLQDQCKLAKLAAPLPL